MKKIETVVVIYFENVIFFANRYTTIDSFLLATE